MPPFRAEDAYGRGGAGGKALRPRRAVAATPYLPSPPPSDRPEQRGWLSGLVSGAGRLLSAVFASSSSSESGDSSCSCSCPDYDPFEASDVEEYRYASVTEGDLEQPGKNLEMVEDQTMDHPPLASIGSSKLLIEQLICQETFTRNECNKLIDMVQSRVTDSPKVDENCAPPYDKLLSRTACSNVASPKVIGRGWSFNWKSPVADGHLHTGSSPRYLSDQGYSPEFCDQAVMEAKKWVQEKRSVSNFKADLSCGPCTLNTEMHQYDSDSDGGSPVALAKSYMHVLPPWKSPRTMTAGFSLTSMESCLEKYEYLDLVSPTNSSLRSTHGDPPSRGLWDTLNITQSWRRHARKSVSLSPLSRHSDFSNGKLDNGYFPTMSRTNRLKPETLHSDSCVAPDNNLLDVPKKLSMDPQKYGSSGAENALKKKTFLDSGLVTDLGASDYDHVEMPREISNVEGVGSSCLTEAKICSTANIAHSDSALVDTSYVLDAEPISMVLENSKVYLSSSPDEEPDQIINGGIASPPRSFGPQRISLQTDAVGTTYDTQETRGETAGMVSRSTQNGLSLQGLRPSGEPSASALDAHVSDNDANKPPNGTTVMSIKKMLRDKPPNLVYVQEKKAAAKPWRGRGKGRRGRKAR